jgi:UDP-N-acetylmuramate: L-alanyl-gamma-D-glutamyl-meso-diaminopimelate ligase
VQLPGEHNVRNAIAAVALANAVGVSPEKARDILPRFRGVKRRLEVKGKARGVIVYDDFAHHPTAVRETLHALRMGATGAGRLFAVFEPRSYTSRTRVFQEDFAHAFEGADAVVVAAAHLPGKVPESQRLSESDLVQAMKARGQDARFIGPVDDIVTHLARELRDGDRVVILSNGGFGGIHGKLLAALGAPAPVTR